MKKRYGFHFIKRAAIGFLVVEAPNDREATMKAQNAKQHQILIPHQTFMLLRDRPMALEETARELNKRQGRW